MDAQCTRLLLAGSVACLQFGWRHSCFPVVKTLGCNLLCIIGLDHTQLTPSISRPCFLSAFVSIACNITPVSQMHVLWGSLSRKTVLLLTSYSTCALCFLRNSMQKFLHTSLLHSSNYWHCISQHLLILPLEARKTQTKRRLCVEVTVSIFLLN